MEKVLLAQNSKSGAKLDEAPLIDDLRQINQEIANRYLEHVVVSRRSPNKVLHQELLNRLLDVAEEEVKDDGVMYHLEELGTSSIQLPRSQC